jgi:triacylglycerol esterase/lipase EstA (alpha/beta hydrolase family)
MVSRATRLLLLLQAAIAALLYLAAHRWLGLTAPLAAAFALAAILVARMVITVNNFGIAWLYRSETPRGHRLGAIGILKMFLAEFSASLASSSWTMAFCSFEHWSGGDPAIAPVLLIHGYGCNSGYWHSMSRALRRAGISHHALDLEPVFAGIDEFVPQVHLAIEAICRRSGHDRLIIVAHSMGGLVARAYLREHGAARIAKIVTLGTPHRGTGLANFGLGPNSAQMRWNGSAAAGQCSAWLRELGSREDPALRKLFVSLYSHQDNIVSPQLSSHLPGAVNVELHGIGHVALALHPRVQARVIEEIRKTGDGRGAPPAT